MGDSSEKIISIGDESAVQFKVNGTVFSCFPLDEMEIISSASQQSDGEMLKGTAFCEVCQSRLKHHGITASLVMSARWYDALVAAWKEQESFFAESPASSGSMESVPLASTGDESKPQKTGRRGRPKSSKSSKTE